ncbi:MFS transporter [Streptomyces echinatus]|uniref:MFS family permease n=1 Tax=Streptomyces echinatus TaxID=67293 RepID=A0A7W9PQ80_9ACTN|nr:MFS transporter [Streptomyces echinatus]MBB5925644.1 MFS family permease [Streptomyces echinatus]
MTAPAPLPDAATPAGSTVAVRYRPGSRAIRRYTFLYALATLGVVLLFGSAAVLLPLHVQELEFPRFFTGADAHLSLQSLEDLKKQVDAGKVSPTPHQERLLTLLDRFNSSRATRLSLVTSVAVFVTMLIQPVIGLLSDRTRSAWGRRAPWIAGGAIAGAALIALFPLVPDIAVLVVLWSLVQMAANVVQGPLSATVADRIPEDRLAGVSTVTGMVGYFGAIVGAAVTGTLFTVMGLAAYFPLAVALALGAVSFVWFARDRSSRDLVVERPRLRSFLSSYVLALGDRDYRWAWIAKVLLFIGYGISTVYAVYMLQSYVSPGLSVDDAAKTAPLVQVAGVPGALVGMAVCGRWSDRIGRRKPFVAAASLIMAGSFLIPFVWPTLPGMFAQAIVGGLGFGVFIVVDQALSIDVLPDPDAVGRDLGLATLGGNLGQAVGPLLAGAVVAVFGGAYGPIWPFACVLVLMAAFAVLPIKRVR